MRVAGSITIALMFFAIMNADADIDTIIPYPKTISAIGDVFSLEGFSIVADACEKAQIGAAEINQRISSLGGQPLPVLDLGAELPAGNLIIIAPCTSNALESKNYDITPSDPGQQGYIIKQVSTKRGFRLFLVGSDTLGTLYAAVTCRQLIVKRDGVLMLQPAAVRDFPDYKYRMNGMPFNEPLRGKWYNIKDADRRGDHKTARKLAKTWIASQKRFFDWMLRAKINMAWNSNIKPGNSPENLTVIPEMLKEVHEYGLKRGIECMAADTTAIGTYPHDKDNPDFKDVVYHRSHKRYFCWSRLEYHEKRAKQAAKWLADCGYMGYYIHATDGGGWQNPALWDNRCPLCRETYGDDHAKADATVFGIYYREIKKHIPDLKFVTVVYPYNGRSLDADNLYRRAADSMGEGEPARVVGRQASEKIRTFLERLNTLLPEDIFVCIRESDRRYIDLIRQAWGKRRFYLYYEYAYWKGWRPYFITTPLWTKTFYSPDHDDILFGNLSGRGWNELTQLLGVECAWNVNRPGSDDYNGGKWSGMGTRYPPPPERKTFAEQACRFWFGDEAGPLIAPVFAENISHTFIYSPDEVMKRLKIEDPAQTMFGQAEACGRAAESLDRLWKLQQKSKVLESDEYAYFLNLYVMTHGAQILATHRAHILAAQRAIHHGDQKETEKCLSAAREALSRSATGWAEIQNNAPKDQMLAPFLRKTAPAGYFMQLDLDELQKEVDNLWNRRERLIAAHTIPDWFERSCRNREIVAAYGSAASITVDGKLDEPAWADAPVIEHFMDYRIRRLESLETRARLVYDEKTLYAAFECFDPDPAGISITMPARDENLLCDSVEILIAPHEGSKEFVHWIVDSKGTIFDARMDSAQGWSMANSRKWSGSAQVKVVRGSDRWTVEMALPAADLGITPAPGLTCRALLCRNIVHTRPKGEEESNSIVFLDGSNFHAVEKFASLRFGEQGETPPAPQVALGLRPVHFKHETIGDGSGTRFGGNLRIEADRNLHDFNITAQCTDGVEPLGKKELGETPLVQLIWRPEEPFSMLFPVEVPGIVCKFIVTSREGTWTFVRRFGSPRRASVPPERLYTQGVDGQALALPAFFSSFNPATIQFSEGTIEFWIKPHWDAVTRASGPRGSLEHTFFNLGPIRPDHPFLSNYDSLTISHSASGYLEGIISNSKYEPRHAQASVRDWRKGQWHHAALQWKLDDGGKTAMAIYIDGKLASDQCVGNPNHPNDQPLEMKPLTLPIQIGSMNTGFRPADADIDELRISSIRRYSQNFTPEKRFEPDQHTITLFHFDGSLNAITPTGVSITPGMAK